MFGTPKLEGVEAGSALVPPYHSPLAVKEDTTGSGFPFVLGKLGDLPKADLVLVVGTDVTPELPPLGWKLMEAKENENFRLVLANPRKTKFDRYASLSLRYKPGSERVLIAGLIKFFLADHPDWTPAIQGTGLDELKESLKKLTPKEIATKTGVDEAVLKELAALLGQAQAPAIVFGTELLAQDKGQQTALALADLFLLVGKPDAPAAPCIPWPKRTTPGASAKWASCRTWAPGISRWKVRSPAPPWKRALDLLEADDPAAPKALYMLGGDLLRWLPHRSRVKKLLKKVPFIVVQDAFLTDTAKLAQVVLPVAVHAEQEGTFISSTGQLGLLNQALPTNGVRPDWQIISQLGAKMGFALKYVSPKEIFKELAKQMPLWAGLAPKLSTPCPKIKKALTGKFVPFETDISLPGRRPHTLIIGKSLQHSGSFTTHHPCGTLSVTGEARLTVNPEDAQSLGLAPGEVVKVISSHGEISAPVDLSGDVPPGVVFLPEHFALPAANDLTLNSNLVRVTIQKG